MKKIISMLLVVVMLFGIQVVPVSAVDYSAYSNVEKNWGLSRSTTHSTPTGPSSEKDLKKYNAYYVGDTSKKVVYLTFDCGYENGNTRSILDTLKKYDIKAVFFVTKAFVVSNPKLVKRMKKEGHLVGNHTDTHPNLAKCSVSRIKSEIKAVEKAIQNETGYKIDKVVRPPEGAYSNRVLKVLKDMGYSTLFWSNAWFDWDVNNQPPVSSVVSKIKDYHHNGMVPLMHNTSSADTKALPEIIKYLKDEGYEFERFDNYLKKDPKLKISLKSFEYNGKRASKKLKVRSKSDGDIKVCYYKKKKKLKRSPLNAGTYKVKVTVGETDKYRSSVKSKMFKIKKAEQQLEVLLSIDSVICDIDTKIEEDSDYLFITNNSKNAGEIKIKYYNSDGGIIEKPQTPGKYTVVVTAKANRNYKRISKSFEFEIIENTVIDI